MAFNIWGSVLPWWRRGVAADMYIYTYIHTICTCKYIQMQIHIRTNKCTLLSIFGGLCLVVEERCHCGDIYIHFHILKYPGRYKYTPASYCNNCTSLPIFGGLCFRGGGAVSPRICIHIHTCTCKYIQIHIHIHTITCT